MDVAEVISKMHHAGFTLSANGDRLSVSPSDRLTDQQRDYLREHKAELLTVLLGADQPGNDHPPANDPQTVSIDHLPLRLRALATRVCIEVHGDGPEAVNEMLLDMAHYPATDWDKLTEHFERQLQPEADHPPANTDPARRWDYQRGWWHGEDGPIRVTAWTPAGNRMTVLANDQAHADRIRRNNPPPLTQESGASPC